MFYCYFIYTEIIEGAQRLNHTYIGATTNVERRLRQHNCEITGGANATKMKVCQGLYWDIFCYLEGIPDWRSTLQIEWKWKQLSRTLYKNKKNPIERRLYSLKKLLSLEKPTENSIEYNTYLDGGPKIVWINNDYIDFYNQIVID
jgi:structure-specific endonuclease subunit SLX1